MFDIDGTKRPQKYANLHFSYIISMLGINGSSARWSLRCSLNSFMNMACGNLHRELYKDNAKYTWTGSEQTNEAYLHLGYCTKITKVPIPQLLQAPSSTLLHPVVILVQFSTFAPVVEVYRLRVSLLGLIPTHFGHCCHHLCTRSKADCISHPQHYEQVEKSEQHFISEQPGRQSCSELQS